MISGMCNPCFKDNANEDLVRYERDLIEKPFARRNKN